MLEDLTPPKIGRSCKVATVLQGLTDKDREILGKAIQDRDNWPIKTLSRELGKRGVQLSESPLSNHRNRTCNCY
jgi:hypothetical protein